MSRDSDVHNVFRDIENHMRRAFFVLGNEMQNRSGASSMLQSTSRGNWSPAFNIEEDAQGYRLFADLPGMTRDKMELNVTSNRICVRGDRPPVSATLEAQPDCSASNWLQLQEIDHGKFERCFTLPSRVIDSDVQAKFVDGLLSVRLRKESPGPNGPKLINIQ